jgi:hypothetical protein
MRLLLCVLLFCYYSVGVRVGLSDEEAVQLPAPADEAAQQVRLQFICVGAFCLKCTCRCCSLCMVRKMAALAASDEGTLLLLCFRRPLRWKDL